MAAVKILLVEGAAKGHHVAIFAVSLCKSSGIARRSVYPVWGR